tara:strand:- start:451 stop:840 length:390 start_codon:yes stop_codon:yes gene_type:complete
MQLDVSSRESAKLHSKYLELMSINRLRLRKFEMELKVLLKKKWLHYNGKLTKAEIDELGWSYDPLNGLKVLKGDMDYYYDADPDIQQQQAKIQYTQEMCDVLKEIMENIKWRHQNIKNMIEWVKFTSGG